jgi:Holin of 3TMs, for gene-transfer release
MADITGIGSVADLLKDGIDKIWPDKTALQEAQLTSFITQIEAQTEIDKAEAQSTDPLQHWRGGLGWVCVLAYLNNFVIVPLANGFGCHIPVLDGNALFTLTGGMLGLGGMHVYQTTKSS